MLTGAGVCFTETRRLWVFGEVDMIIRKQDELKGKYLIAIGRLSEGKDKGRRSHDLRVHGSIRTDHDRM